MDALAGGTFDGARHCDTRLDVEPARFHRSAHLSAPLVSFPNVSPFLG
jgi:hypothetical protein